MKVEYEGLDASSAMVPGAGTTRLTCQPEELREGVASLLDYLRRKRVLYDPEREIFSKYWMDGDLEVQQGYLPQVGNPIGTKLRRGPTEKAELVTQWLSEQRRHDGPPDGEEVGRRRRTTPRHSSKRCSSSSSTSSCWRRCG